MKKWTGILRCRDCGKELNRAVHVPNDEKTLVALGAGLSAGSCPNGCRSTLSDLNLNTTLEWVEEVVLAEHEIDPTALSFTITGTGRALLEASKGQGRAGEEGGRVTDDERLKAAIAEIKTLSDWDQAQEWLKSDDANIAARGYARLGRGELEDDDARKLIEADFLAGVEWAREQDRKGK